MSWTFVLCRKRLPTMPCRYFRAFVYTNRVCQWRGILNTKFISIGSDRDRGFSAKAKVTIGNVRTDEKRERPTRYGHGMLAKRVSSGLALRPINAYNDRRQQIVKCHKGAGICCSIFFLTLFTIGQYGLLSLAGGARDPPRLSHTGYSISLSCQTIKKNPTNNQKRRNGSKTNAPLPGRVPRVVPCRVCSRPIQQSKPNVALLFVCRLRGRSCVRQSVVGLSVCVSVALSAGWFFEVLTALAGLLLNSRSLQHYTVVGEISFIEAIHISSYTEQLTLRKERIFYRSFSGSTFCSGQVSRSGKSPPPALIIRNSFSLNYFVCWPQDTFSGGIGNFSCRK